ncbi:MAG: transposase [bacterium]|nr:transposase [bacterium]
MAKKFGDLLKRYRTKAKSGKISQEKLGHCIGATRQYIDAVEKSKANTPPPKFDVCLKLSDALDLEDDVKREFLLAAFNERIRNNMSFYKYLHQEVKAVEREVEPHSQTISNSAGESGEFSNGKDTISIDLISGFSSGKHGQIMELSASPLPSDKSIGVSSGLYYRLNLHFKSGLKGDGIETLTELELVLSHTLSRMGYRLFGFSVKREYVSIIMQLDVRAVIFDVVQAIKNVLSREIKARYDIYDRVVGSLWNDNYHIVSVGPTPDMMNVKSTQQTPQLALFN